MKTEKIEFLSAVLITSKHHDKLAQFYIDIVGLPLEAEQHSDTVKHYGCDLGDIHFAIHPVENFTDKSTGPGAIKLAFTVFDIEAFVKKVEASGHKVEYKPKDLGFSIMTAMYDLDGNYIEFTQLSDRWFKHLEKRKSSGTDIVQKWKNQQTKSGVTSGN